MKQHFTQFAAFIFVLAIFPFYSVHAQNTSPYWSLAGNSNVTTTTKFGTTNAQNLRILTNNIERMRVLANGNIGIGTVTAPNKLTVAGSASFANIVGVNGPSNALYALSVTGGSKAGIVVTNAGNNYVLYAQKNGAGNAIFISNNTTTAYDPLMSLLATGSARGINVTTTSNIAINAQSTSLFGLYGSSNSSAGAVGTSLTSSGVLGTSTSGPGGNFQSQTYHGLYAKTVSRTAGIYAGVFEGSVYTYGTFSASDGRLKKDVNDLTGGLEAIMKLKPKNYEFRQDGQFEYLNLPAGKHYGFIAQELEEVMPWAVQASDHEMSAPAPVATIDPDGTAHPASPNGIAKKPDMMSIKAINYTEIIPVVVKAMQEQEEKIKSLESQVEKLTALVSKLSGQPVAISVSSAYLEQNVPNPPKGNNTRIGYYIPESSSLSALVVFDATGKKLKEIRLSQTGHGFINLNTSAMAQGSYSYSLLVDGRLSDTKKLVIAR